MKIPPNRVVAFAGPYIAIASGVIADWLLIHVHVLSTFHTNKTQVASAITQVAVFGLTSLIVWLGQQKWLTGWQLFENAVAGDGTNGPELLPENIPGGEYDAALAGGDSAPVEPTTTVIRSNPGVPLPPLPPSPPPTRPISDNPQA